MFRSFLLLLAFIACRFTSFAEDITVEEIKEMLPKYLGSSNAGTEFVFTFHPSWIEVGNASMKIYISSEFITSIKAEIPAFGYSEIKTSIPQGVIEFSFDPISGGIYYKSDKEPPLPEKIWEGRSVILKSDKPIICYGITRYHYTSDGYLALPVNKLGTKYSISSFEDPNGVNSFMTSYSSIISPYDSNEVEIILGGNQETWLPSKDENAKEITNDEKGFLIGDTLTRMMNRGDVWLLGARGKNGDLSGTIVNSSKPVSVISGSFCAYIPAGVPACDYTISQELPQKDWGKKYHISPIIERKKTSWIKVYPKEDNTSIYINNELVATIDTAGWEENVGYLSRRALSENDTNQAVLLYADKPISVTQYNTGSNDDGIESDPFQMVLVPESKYITEFSFNTPGIRGGSSFRVNYLNVIYKAEEDGSIPQDIVLYRFKNYGTDTISRKLSDMEGKTFKFPRYSSQDNRDYYCKQIILEDPTAAYKIKANDPIMCYMYGYDLWDSYGYPASINFSTVNTNDTMPPVIVSEKNFYNSSEIIIEDVDNTGNSENTSISYAYLIDQYSENVNFELEYQYNKSRTANIKLDLIDNEKEGIAYIYAVDNHNNFDVFKIIVNNTNSVKSKTNAFSIHPNPANDKITIAYENGIENIKIMDLNGQVVFESKYNYLSNVLIDLSNITVGVYFIELNEDKELMQKIIVE